MSREISATIGYGLFIPVQVYRDNYLDEDPPDGTKIISAGSLFVGDCNWYLCIEETVQEDEGTGTPLNSDSFVLEMKLGPVWRLALSNLASELGIENPQIGWFLCACEG